MAARTRERIVVIVFGLLVTTAIILPFLAVNAFGLALNDTEIAGIPIQDTVFNNIVNATADGAVFPPGEAKISNESFSVVVDYSDMPRINLTQAVASVRQFGNRLSYLKDVNLTLDEGWTRLDPDCWTLRFRAGSFSIVAGVNAFTGKVISFHLSSWNDEPLYVREYNGTAPLSTEEVEEKATDFFTTFGYSLSECSLYLPPKVVPHPGFIGEHVYRLEFLHIINNTPISGDAVRLFLDIETGEMVSFRYRWNSMPNIPLDVPINRVEAELKALRYAGGHPELRVNHVVSSFKILRSIGSRLMSSHFEYKLVWEIQMGGSSEALVYIDCFSSDVVGAIYDISASDAATNNRRNSEIILLIMVPSFVLGVVVHLITKRHLIRSGTP